MSTEEDIIATFSAAEQATARRLNEASGLRHYILDENNVPMAVGLGTWAIWYERESQKPSGGRRRVASDEWDDPTFGHVHVSTVFLALDHSFDYVGPRLLFETMVFWGWEQNFRKGGAYMGGQLQWRYPTEATARAGHARALKLTQAFLSGQITREEFTEARDAHV